MDNLPSAQLIGEIDQLTKGPKWAREYKKHVNPTFNESLNVARERAFMVQAIVNSDKLPGCSARSFEVALQSGARTGLSFDTNKGHLYLVPYAGQAKLQIGYKGMTHMAYCSSTLKSIDVQLVNEGDFYEEERTSSGITFKHKPNRPKKAKDKVAREIIGVYCHAIFYPDIHFHEYMSIADILAIEAAAGRINNGKQSPAWRFFRGQMVRKAVIRRAYVYWPKDKTLEEMMSVINEVEENLFPGDGKQAPEQEAEDYLSITEDQEREIYSLIYDWNYSRHEDNDEAAKKHTLNWVDQLCDLLVVPSLSAIPQQRFEEARQRVLDRQKKIEDNDKGK